MAAKARDVLKDKKTRWTKLVVPCWCGDYARCILEIATGTAVWYHPGSPPAPIRWVLLHDPARVRDAQAFLCTELALDPPTFLSWFVSRRSTDASFQDSREHLGVETQRQWSDFAAASDEGAGVAALQAT